MPIQIKLLIVKSVRYPLIGLMTSETAIYRYRPLNRDYNAQSGEIMAGDAVMNKVPGLGMPIEPRPNSTITYQRYDIPFMF
jgi:hypothetical protein